MVSGLLRSRGSVQTFEAPEHSVATRLNSGSRREERIRRAPARAKRFARASPIPLDAPVIQITLSLNSESAILTVFYKNLRDAIICNCNHPRRLSYIVCGGS